MERSTDAVTPASCLSFGYSAGTNLLSFGAFVTTGSSAAAATGRSAAQITSARTTGTRADLIPSISQLEAGLELVNASRDRLSAHRRRLETPPHERRLDRGVERRIDAAHDLHVHDVAVGADDDPGLEEALDPVLLRLRVEAVVDLCRHNWNGLRRRLVARSFAGGAFGLFARHSRAPVRDRRGDLHRRRRRPGGPPRRGAREADARTDVLVAHRQ